MDSMTITINGATRVNFIVGDPVAQVKSPAGMTAAFQREGLNAVMIPAQVSAKHLTGFLEAAENIVNCDGIVVTVPHKFACFEHCATVTDRAALLRAVNVMRRGADGRWHGDMVDGLGFVSAAEDAGVHLKGKKALVVGAGGAGSAIALGLLEAGVDTLAIHDLDAPRRDRLIEKLRGVRGSIYAGSSNPAGYDLIANATPAGMSGHDYLPVDISGLAEGMVVGCVVTEPQTTPLIAAARRAGCITITGSGMYRALEGIMLEYLADGSMA